MLNLEEYQKMYILEDFYWWFVGRRKIIVDFLKGLYTGRSNRKILDVGCGTGAILKYLDQFGSTMGVDKSAEALRFCRSRARKSLLQGDAQKLPIRDNIFDLVTAFDLLEHIEVDEQALKEFYRVTKKDGMLLMTVPAYRFLWSEHDEALGHKRRYGLKELKGKVLGAGFKIIKISYAITILFFPILVIRLLQKIFKPRKEPKTALIMLPGLMNSFFSSTLYLEAMLLRKLYLPFGVSIICIAQK